MSPKYILLCTSILLVSYVSPVTSVSGYVKNNCPISIWAKGSMCGGIDSGDPIQLNQGNEYYSPYDAQDNSCGFTIKIGNNPDMSYVYQIEYSVTDGGV